VYELVHEDPEKVFDEDWWVRSSCAYVFRKQPLRCTRMVAQAGPSLGQRVLIEGHESLGDPHAT
jgi:hypothetical protein